MVAKITMGEIVEIPTKHFGHVNSGRVGAKVRAEKLIQIERTPIAKRAAAAHWK